MNTCTKCILDINERNYLLQLLNQLQNWRNHYGYNDSSVTKMLNDIGKYLQESHLSQLSLYFYLEQLRIEEFYLGRLHPDLADTLNNIGEAYAGNDQFSKAEEYFAEALLLMKNNKRKGNLLALILYNMGSVKYHQLLFADALENFDLAVTERKDALGEFHPDVAEMHLNIGKLQLECGKVDIAMKYFLNALMIVRISIGNNSSEVSEILYHIGLGHVTNGECTEALNSFYQALHIVDENFHDEICMVMILHNIGLTYQYMGDISNAINTFQSIINITKRKVGEEHICVAVVLGLLRNLYTEQGMVEKSRDATENIKDICCNTSAHLVDDRNREFVEFIIEIFGYFVEDDSPLAAAAA